MDYENSAGSSLSEGIEDEYDFEHSYEKSDEIYIESRMNNSHTDEEDEFTHIRSSRENYLTSRDKYNRSFSRLDFLNAEPVTNPFIHHKLKPEQFEQLQEFYNSNKSSNGLLCVKLLNYLLTSNNFFHNSSYLNE